VQAEKLQLSAPEDQIVEARRRFVDEARVLGDEAIEAKRTDSAAEIGRILMEGGEARFAEAFLQRCMGLLKPAEAGKHHIYPLAQLRRADGRALEAASLYERAIDVEPTTESEYVGLSDLYLAADRIGPARAAVSRGLRKHEGSVVLKVQGAKVALLDGKAEEAMASVVEVLAGSADDVAAQLVQIEAMLALGKLSESKASSTALREEFPADAWGWIFGGAIAALEGEVKTSSELLDQAAELAGDCPCTHEERLAIAWASTLRPADRCAPRSRAEEQKTRGGAASAATTAPSGTSPEPR
jgi:tetratricopeptide (TPR) repeat protein